MDFKRLRRRLRWPFAYATVRTICWIIQLLPLRLVEGLAASAGRLFFSVPSVRRLILANLQLAFPEWDETRRIHVGRRSLANLILIYLEFIWYQKRLDRLYAGTYFRDQDLAAIQELRQAGKPAIFCSPHIGGWERGFVALNHRVEEVSAVARKIHNPFLDRYFQSLRTASGGSIIYEKGAVRAMFKALKRSIPLFVLVDQNTKPHQGGMFADFFGVPASMSRAPAMMLKRTQAALFQCWAIRHPDRTYSVTMELLLPPGEHDMSDEAIGRLLNARTEQIIREHPEQYVWLYERWRYIPPDYTGDTSIFPDYANTYRDRKRERQEKHLKSSE